MPSNLDLVHARIILIEHLRGTGPDLEKVGDRLLNDSLTLALRLCGDVSREMARRRRLDEGESQEP